MIIFALNTGMRVGEILNLKWEHLFIQQNYLVALNPKNGKPRKILLNKTLKNSGYIVSYLNQIEVSILLNNNRI